MKDQLAARIKMGDEQAFELLFHRYYVRLCGFANKFLNDQEASKEIVQEVFLKIWNDRQNIDPDDSLKSYLFKIAQNMSLNRLRRIKVELKYIEIYKLVYLENSDFSAYESLLAKELEKNIAIAIDKLSPECKKIFNLSRIEGLKYIEIALRLNISVKTVETQMSKALRLLKQELSDYLILIVIVFVNRL
jgi:RNA polymerase sigma-70 factor (ECF subfamily)